MKTGAVYALGNICFRTLNRPNTIVATKDTKLLLFLIRAFFFLMIEVL